MTAVLLRQATLGTNCLTHIFVDVEYNIAEWWVHNGIIVQNSACAVPRRIPGRAPSSQDEVLYSFYWQCL